MTAAKRDGPCVSILGRSRWYMHWRRILTRIGLFSSIPIRCIAFKNTCCHCVAVQGQKSFEQHLLQLVEDPRSLPRRCSITPRLQVALHHKVDTTQLYRLFDELRSQNYEVASDVLWQLKDVCNFTNAEFVFTYKPKDAQSRTSIECGQRVK